MKNINFGKLFFIAALAANSSESNADAIYLQGSIGEEGCRIAPQKEIFHISCSKQGKPVVYQASLTKLENYSMHSDSPTKTCVHYLDPRHKRAILEIVYRYMS